MAKRLTFFLTLLIAGSTANGQALWLQPSKFYNNSNERWAINIMEGVDFQGEPWEMFADAVVAGKRKNLVNMVELHQEGRFTDISHFAGKAADHDLVLPPQADGSYWVVMETANLFTRQDAEAFNAYLKEEALDEAYAHRQKTNTLNESGKELYIHCARVLVQVGNQTDNTFKKETGLTVEVIPQQHPASLKVGDRVQFKVMYDGKPAFGARVKVFNRYQNRISVQNIFSEQNGMIETHISNPGTWMVSFVRMIPSADSRADWQSYKASMVFGIK